MLQLHKIKERETAISVIEDLNYKYGGTKGGGMMLSE